MSIAPPPAREASIPQPHSIEAEEAVLGAVLLSSKVFPTLRLEEGLAAEHFYRDQHRAIFEAMCELHARGDAIDVLTVTAELERRGTLSAIGGKATVDSLTGGVPGLGGVRRYAKIVSEHWVKREQLTSTYEQQVAILNHDDDAYQAALQRAHAVVASGISDGFLGPDVLADHMNEWLQAPQEEGLPLPAELSSLARMIRLRPGHLTVVGAWPSHGKTSLLSAMAAAIGFKGHRVVIWTNEDTAEELVAKHVMAQTGIPASVVSDRQIHDSRMPKVLREIATLPFEVQPCHDWTAAQIAAHIRQVRPAVAIVDHFHNLQGIGEVKFVDESIRVLAAAAGQAATHLVLAAQLNRNRLNGVCKPPPVPSDLRGSAMFLAAAHTMLLVHRDEEELEDADGTKLGKAVQLETGTVDVAKNKVTGKTGVVPVVFDPDRLRFIEPARGQASDPDAWLR